MEKFAVLTEGFEFNPTKYRSPIDAFNEYDDHNSKTIGIFDTMDEALSALEKIPVSTYRYNYRCARAEIAFIEIADFELNDDGEWEFVMGSDYDEFRYEDLPADEEEV